MRKEISVWVLDDHPLYIRGLENLLSLAPDVKINSRSFNQSKLFLDALQEKQPDLVFLDINLPEINGIEISKRIQKNYPRIKFVALSSHTEPKIVKEFMKSGAHGYMLKSISDTELYTCITAVLSGKIYFSEEVKTVFIEKTLLKSDSNSLSKPKLTPREKEVLTLIISEKTTAEIAAQLFLSEATIETHRMNLFQKLNVKNVAGLVREAYELKLLEG